MGETFRKATASREARAMAQAHQVWQPARAIRTAGTRMSATAAGRTAWKMRRTMSLSLNSVKNIAISRMISREGRTAPTEATTLPFSPLILWPVKMAMLTARMPGALCARTMMSWMSSSEIQPRRVISCSMSGSIA